MIETESYTIADDGRTITCHACEYTSYNLSDVRNRYCGRCKVFHQDAGKLIGCALFIFRPGSNEPQTVNVRMHERPSLAELKAVIMPYLDRGDGTKPNLEHVSVLFQDRPADMFVDEIGLIDGLPRNEAATDIYRSFWRKHHPEDDPESLPHIAGPALIFSRRVWF